MKKITFTVLCLILTTFVGAGSLWAQKQGNIELKALAEIEIEDFNEEGKMEIKRIAAAKVVPGDEVIYTVFYTNVSRDKVDNVLITNPIPQHMLYKAGSAAGEDAVITFSVDGGKTYDRPENLKVRDAAGKEFPAEASDYTHIRWVRKKSLSPNTESQVSFRAKLQ